MNMILRRQGSEMTLRVRDLASKVLCFRWFEYCNSVELENRRRLLGISLQNTSV